MTTPHPMFISIFRAYGVVPAGPFECMYCQQGTDNENDICDECANDKCQGCGVTKELHKHCEAPCPFDECPFKKTVSTQGD